MRALGLLIVLTLATGAPAQAAPRFGPARTITASGADVGIRPAAAIDRRGRFVVAWVRRDGRVLARRGHTHVLSRHSAFHVDAALRHDGTAVVGWERDGAHGRRYVETSVGFGAVQRLATVHANLLGPRLVAVPGRLVAVWWQGVPATGGHEVRYAIAGADGRFGRAHALATTDPFSPISAVADAAGDVMVAFATPSSVPRAAVATLAAGATAFGAPQVVADAADPTLFAGPGGTALGYGVQSAEPWRLEFSPPGGAPVTVATIDGRNGRTGFEGPVVALPAHGGALAAWTVTRFATEESELPNRAALYASGAAPVRLTPPRALAHDLHAAATGDAAILTWTQHRRLLYAVRGRGGGFARPRTLARRQAESSSALAAAGDHALAVWFAGRAVRFSRLRG